jgi:hypothetical protein
MGYSIKTTFRNPESDFVKLQQLKLDRLLKLSEASNLGNFKSGQMAII